VLDHTLTNEVVSAHVKDVLNDIGTFSFTVGTTKGVNSGRYLYNDIALDDKIKFYFWDAARGSCPANPQFVGKVSKINGPLNLDSGFHRVIEGKMQGEILERRFKMNKRWQAAEADDIVADIASDLGLGAGDIAVDTTAESITVRTESYFDILKRVSDYWLNAGSQVKKDFYVDADNDLVWKARPIRTVAVETFTVNLNIDEYTVLRDVLGVKNKIYVYGALGQKYPAGPDDWTDSLTDWTADIGTLSLANGVNEYKAGSWGIKATPVGGGSDVLFHRTFDRITIRDINMLKFWRNYSAVNPSTYEVHLWAPDVSNYFESTAIGVTSTWQFKELPLGPNQMYDAALNPNGIWIEGAGNPNWWDLKAIEFYIFNGVVNTPDFFDVIYFEPLRFYNSAENAASQSSYGIREAEFVDDTLLSNTECQQRAEALLFQLKDPATRVDVTTKLNMNVLLGDQLTLTLPAESISAAAYDVVSVEHDYAKGRPASTKFTALGSSNTRLVPPATVLESIRRNMTYFKSSSCLDRKHTR
jgi:hypothetical protein